MKQPFACPHCRRHFVSHTARALHAADCPEAIDWFTVSLWNKHAGARYAAASRKRNNVPDWTNGLLKPWKGEAA